MTREYKHYTATAMIQNNKGKFLLHKHPKLGFWLPPGGHIEANEEPQDAVMREVLEETGLACRVIDCAYPMQKKVSNSDHVYALPIPLAILKEFIRDSKKGDHWHIDMVYLCELIAPDETPNSTFCWISFEELPSLDIPDDVVELATMVKAYYNLNRITLDKSE